MKRTVNPEENYVVTKCEAVKNNMYRIKVQSKKCDLASPINILFPCRVAPGTALQGLQIVEYKLDRPITRCGKILHILRVICIIDHIEVAEDGTGTTVYVNGWSPTQRAEMVINALLHNGWEYAEFYEDLDSCFLNS